jgi:hypothetical protein
MKRTLLLITALVVTAFQVNAQNDTIPNPSYEHWFTENDVELIQSWSSTNPWVSLVGIVNIFKDSDAYDGDFAVELKTVIVPIGPFNVPGLITLGSVAVNVITTEASIEGGIPWTSKPAMLKGYYKYNPADGDSCGIIALFTRFIPAKGKRDTLGIGTFYSTQTVEEWTQFNMNINFFSAEIPDSMNIIVSSSASLFDPIVGSTLWVDAFEFEGSSGIGLDIIPNVGVNVYPNPAKNYVTFAFEKSINESELIIYNLDGQMVRSDLVSGKEKTLQVGDLPAGTYYFHLLDGRTRISSGSFLVGE